ncbi:putative reverse transcriptase domain-containing protein [Tanacetum coccineum]
MGFAFGKPALRHTLSPKTLTYEYEKFSISNKETINSGFTRFNAIVTSLKSLDPDYSSKNHVRKFLLALPLKWRANVTVIEEAKDLATLPLDELIGNLKVYEMILASDGVASKPIKEKFMPIALKANVTRGQTSNDNVCQDRSDEDEDEEEEEFNSIVRNLWKLFKKGNRFERENRFGNSGDKFDRGRGGRSKGVGSSRRERRCYGCGSKNHFVDDCLRAKVKKAFIGGAWSDSDDGDQIEKDATCLMAIGSQKVNLNPSHFDNNVNELQNNYTELVKINFEITKTNESLLKENSILEQKRIRLNK